MGKLKSKTFLVVAGLIALALAVVFFPGIYKEHIAWRLGDLQSRIAYFLHPPQNAVFVPTQQYLLTQTVGQPTGTPSPTPLPTGQATPTVTATPPPASVILANIPFVDQMNRWNYCGPANLSMALEYWGWKGVPGNTSDLRDQIAQVIKPGENDPDKGFIADGETDVNVMPYEMVDFVNDYTEYRALYRFGGDIDLLKRLIAAGYPVIAEKGIYQELPPTYKLQWAGHYAFTTGYDDSQREFVWQDSYLPKPDSVGKNSRMSYSDYSTNWRAFDYVFIVVYPADREAELLSLLGPWADYNWAVQHALDIANQEIPTLSGTDRFFAMFNKVTSLVELFQYGDAAAAYDQAIEYYNTQVIPNENKDRLPYRIMWYQTGPYKAYYWTSRFQDVINLANTNLKTLLPGRQLEETYYWRARAEYMLGEYDQAYADLREAYYLNKNLQATLDLMQAWGVSP